MNIAYDSNADGDYQTRLSKAKVDEFMCYTVYHDDYCNMALNKREKLIWSVFFSATSNKVDIITQL